MTLRLKPVKFIPKILYSKVYTCYLLATKIFLWCDRFIDAGRKTEDSDTVDVLLSIHTFVMPRRKKLFPCGHKGYGQICHLCAQETAVLEQKKQKKQEWESTFAHDPIDLRELPIHVVVKARTVIAALKDNKNYTDFGGKRLRHDRLIVSIPITRNYRMLCRDCGDVLIPLQVLSHEDYNVRKPGC